MIQATDAQVPFRDLRWLMDFIAANNRLFRAPDIVDDPARVRASNFVSFWIAGYRVTFELAELQRS